MSNTLRIYRAFIVLIEVAYHGLDRWTYFNQLTNINLTVYNLDKIIDVVITNGPVKNFALVLYTAGIEDRLDILTEAQVIEL